MDYLYSTFMIILGIGTGLILVSVLGLLALYGLFIFLVFLTDKITRGIK